MGIIRNIAIAAVAATVSLASLTARAGNVAELVDRLGLGDVSCDTVLHIDACSHTKDIRLKYTPGVGAEHIGLSLFSPEIKSISNPDICNFIERLTLYLIVVEKNEGKEYLRRHRITLSHNGTPYGEARFSDMRRIVDRMGYPSVFNIDTDGARYSVVFSYDDTNTLYMSFPAARETVFGTDKSESDTLIFHQLANSADTSAPDIPAPDVLEPAGEGIWCRPGSMFMIEKIRSDRYYDAAANPVFSEAFPRESALNMLQGVAASDKRMRICHRMYGNYTPDFEITIGAFLASFRSGFEIYAAAEPSGDNAYRCVVILRNTDYRYIHMLVLNVKTDAMFGDDAVLSADLFTNISQDRLKSLF